MEFYEPKAQKNIKFISISKSEWIWKFKIRHDTIKISECTFMCKSPRRCTIQLHANIPRMWFPVFIIPKHYHGDLWQKHAICIVYACIRHSQCASQAQHLQGSQTLWPQNPCNQNLWILWKLVENRFCV